jgi:hypothetical protein
VGVASSGARSSTAKSRASARASSSSGAATGPSTLEQSWSRHASATKAASDLHQLGEREVGPPRHPGDGLEGGRQRRQRSEAHHQRAQRRIHQAIARPQRLLDAVKERLHRDGLDQQVVREPLERLHPGRPRLAGISGEHHPHQRRPAGDGLGQQPRAVELRHADVGDQRVKGPLGEGGECAGARGDELHFPLAVAKEREAQRLHDRRLVVDEEHAAQRGGLCSHAKDVTALRTRRGRDRG